LIIAQQFQTADSTNDADAPDRRSNQPFNPPCLLDDTDAE